LNGFEQGRFDWEIEAMTKTNDTQSYKLVTGEFSVEEARHILFSLVESKIGFHRIKNLSHKERLGTADGFSEKRAVELEQIKTELQALIDRMEASNGRLSINCDICIQALES